MPPPIAKSLAIKAKGEGKGPQMCPPPVENLLARISRDRAAVAKASGTTPKEGHLYVPPVPKTRQGPPAEQEEAEMVPPVDVVLRKARPKQLPPWRQDRETP